MEMLKLVYLQWVSQERDKYIWQDCYEYAWDEIIGRMYLLKAHYAIDNRCYADALTDFEQALLLLIKDNVRQEYYACALADKALIQCFLGQYDTALTTSEQALAVTEQEDRDLVENNHCAILVLAGAYTNALELLQARLKQHPKEGDALFTLATCLLHLERYDEAAVAYEQAIAEDSYFGHEKRGLNAAYHGQQPNWEKL